MNRSLETHIKQLFDSYQSVTGRILGDDSWKDLNDQELVTAVQTAPCVIASHGAEADPILNFGNQTALDLWETTWEKLTAMPSRLTAEPDERSERERLLHEVTTHGFIDNYSGIRVSTTGKRFRIDQATVWTVQDAAKTRLGQAVIFSDWEYL